MQSFVKIGGAVLEKSDHSTLRGKREHTVHCGIMKNSFSPECFSSNQPLNDFFSKCVAFTKFLPIKREWISVISTPCIVQQWYVRIFNTSTWIRITKILNVILKNYVHFWYLVVPNKFILRNITEKSSNWWQIDGKLTLLRTIWIIRVFHIRTSTIPTPIGNPSPCFTVIQFPLHINVIV